MSVIFGKINLDNSPIESREIAAMENKLNHWRADASNIWFDDCAAFGHLMLYNTPESLDEKLPLHDSLSKLTITADARLDNRYQIFEKLGLAASETLNLPDSHLILRLYQKYGENCVEYMLGDFAFAVWDAPAQKLFCARDHLGVKPFFYYCDNRIFAFASEIKGLLVVEQLEQRLNVEFINTILGRKIPLVKTTFYQCIWRLEPAHTLVFDKENRLRISRYWDLDSTKEICFSKKSDYAETFREKMIEAITCRLRSVYPIGAELSGGLDSTGITCIANKILEKSGKKLSTLSFTLGDADRLKLNGENDESSYIDLVNKECGITQIHKITSSGKSHLEKIDRELFVNDGLDNHSALWQEPLREIAAKNQIRVLLSGFPGDELVTYSGRLGFVGQLDDRNYLKFFTDGFNKVGARETFFYLLRYFQPRLFRQLETSQIYARHVKRRINKERAFLNKLVERVNLDFYQSDLHLNRSQSLRNLQKYRILSPVATPRLESETKFGIAHKVETRFPMADVRLLEFVLALPAEIKYDLQLTRPIYRAAMKNLMPEEIRLRNNKDGYALAFAPIEMPIDIQQNYRWLRRFAEQHPKINFPKIYSALLERNEIPSLNEIYNVPFPINKLTILARYCEKNPLLAEQVKLFH